MNKLSVYDPRKRKIVLCGNIDGDTFIKDVVFSRHFMKTVGGYGIQENAFNELKKRKVENILINEQDTKRSWFSKLVDWEKKGKIDDYGSGKQIFLSIEHMFNSGD